MTYQFDPNSTKNEGRWRLIDPKKFVKDKGSWFRKKDDRYPGISYVFGYLKDKHGRKTGGPVRQTIRFNKRIWSENKAREWWEKHSHEYNKEWSPEDWVEWEKEQEEEKLKKELLIKKEAELKEQMSEDEDPRLQEEYESARKKAKKQKPKSEKISRRKALALSKKIIESLGVRYVSQKDVTINSEWVGGIGFPAGSVRQGKEEVGDLDIIVTKQITREMIEDLDDENITDLKGGEKRIDFVYNYKCKEKGVCHIGVNIFIYRSKKTWGAALIHTTGPWQYNVYIRRKVKSFGEGWTLSQNGLVNGFDEIVPTPTEKRLMSKIGVTIRTPSERLEHKRQ